MHAVKKNDKFPQTVFFCTDKLSIDFWLLHLDISSKGLQVHLGMSTTNVLLFAPSLIERSRTCQIPFSLLVTQWGRRWHFVIFFFSMGMACRTVTNLDSSVRFFDFLFQTIFRFFSSQQHWLCYSVNNTPKGSGLLIFFLYTFSLLLKNSRVWIFLTFGGHWTL